MTGKAFGDGDFIDFNVPTELNFLGTSTDISFGFIIDLTSDSGWRTVLGCHDSGDTFRFGLQFNTANLVLLTGEFPLSGVNWTSGHVFVLVSKASGDSTARWHLYDYAGDSWSHTDGAESQVDDGTGISGGAISFGRLEDFGEFIEADFFVAGFWNETFTNDSAVEAAGLHTALVNWLDFGTPIEVFDFSQTPVTALITGTSINNGTEISDVTDNDPPGFNFSLSHEIDLGLIESTELFNFTVELGLFAELDRIASTQLFDFELVPAQGLTLGFLQSTQLFDFDLITAPEVFLDFLESTQLFDIFVFAGDTDPIVSGGGSVRDQIFQGLIAQGFTEGSITDRERARLLLKAGLEAPQNLSMMDLYTLVGEENRLGL